MATTYWLSAPLTFETHGLRALHQLVWTAKLHGNATLCTPHPLFSQGGSGLGESLKSRIGP